VECVGLAAMLSRFEGGVEMCVSVCVYLGEGKVENGVCLFMLER
jgi:hypothetical protein